MRAAKSKEAEIVGLLREGMFVTVHEAPLGTERSVNGSMVQLGSFQYSTAPLNKRTLKGTLI